jgi:hypothetical protein
MARLWLALAIILSLGASGAAASPTGTRPVPRTLLATKAPIHGFAQDTASIAWTDAHYYVHVRKLDAKLGTIVGAARDPSGIRFGVGPLVLAGMQALWVSYSHGNNLYTDVRTGSARLGRYDVWTAVVLLGNGNGNGDFVTDMSADGTTLVFGRVGQRCDDEFNCRRLDASGAVARVTDEATDVPGLPTPLLVATSAGRIAAVPVKTPRFYPDLGAPRAADFAPVQVYGADGQLISTIVTPGIPRSIALAWPKLAVLVEHIDGSREIRIHDARTGDFWRVGDDEAVFGNVPMNVTGVAVGSAGAVYSSGRSIYLLRRQLRPELVWRASAPPVGLSIEGRRIAWAENAGKTARIRALTVAK